VIALGTNEVVGTLATGWRADLPFVAPDGGIAVRAGKDVIVTDGTTLRRPRESPGGGRLLVSLPLDGLPSACRRARPAGGFRRTACRLQRRRRPTPAPPKDTGAAPVAPAPAPPPPPRDTAVRRPPAGYTVSFAALLVGDKARELAASIHVGSENARVVTAVRDGSTIYRVVLGPTDTRDGRAHRTRVEAVLLDLRGRTLSATRTMDWNEEGRRIGVTLDAFHAIVVVGTDPDATAETALGIARVQAVHRRVALGDLLGEAPPIQALVRGDDPHGLVDSFVYGVSLSKIAQQVPESGELFVMPTGTGPVDYEELFGSDRWRRLDRRVSQGGRAAHPRRARRRADGARARGRQRRRRDRRRRRPARGVGRAVARVGDGSAAAPLPAPVADEAHVAAARRDAGQRAALPHDGLERLEPLDRPRWSRCSSSPRSPTGARARTRSGAPCSRRRPTRRRREAANRARITD
jgi:hypothetical protein